MNTLNIDYKQKYLKYKKKYLELKEDVSGGETKKDNDKLGLSTTESLVNWFKNNKRGFWIQTVYPSELILIPKKGNDYSNLYYKIKEQHLNKEWKPGDRYSTQYPPNGNYQVFQNENFVIHPQKGEEGVVKVQNSFRVDFDRNTTAYKDKILFFYPSLGIKLKDTTLKYNKIIKNYDEYLKDKTRFDINDLNVAGEINTDNTQKSIEIKKIDDNCKEGRWSSCKTYITFNFRIEQLYHDNFERRKNK